MAPGRSRPPVSDEVLTFPGARSPAPASPLSDPRLHQVFLLGFSVAVIFVRLWETSLASYDDTYYAEKAKEMVATGQWLVPYWNYEPAFDNPPLYMWLTALLFRAFGVSEFAARFTSAVAGVGCILLTYRLGRRLFGHWAGLFGGIALLMTPYFIKYSRHAMLDTTQTLLVTGSIYLLYLGLQRQRTLWIDLGAGVLMGLAVLNKSLLGYLPLGVYVLYTIAARIPPRRALRPGLAGTLAAALALPGAWFGLVYARHGMPFLEEHFGRILWSRAVHGDPGQTLTWLSPFGHVTGLLKSFQPWILVAMFGTWVLFRRRADPRRSLLPVCWAVATVVLLSLATAKKSWYVMPAFPALAILAGVGLEALLPDRERWRGRFAAGVAALLGLYVIIVAGTPVPVGRDRNRDVKAIGAAARNAVPRGTHVLNFNLEPHWRYVSALYFYADRPLALPVMDESEMVRILTEREAEAILTDLPTLSRLQDRLPVPPQVLAGSGELVLIGPGTD